MSEPKGKDIIESEKMNNEPNSKVGHSPLPLEIILLLQEPETNTTEARKRLADELERRKREQMEKADEFGSEWVYGAESDFDEGDALKVEG
jgi:hypothetical protein